MTFVLDPQVRLVMNDALRQLKPLVATTDIAVIQSTSLKDFEDTARQLEHNLAARGSSCNMARLKPLLEGLARFSGAATKLCEGTLLLPWLWAPVKFILQICVAHLPALNQLLTSYKRLAQSLPSFENLSTNFTDSSAFQQILAVIYSRILEIHQQVYKLIRRPGWEIFFDTSWDQCERHFQRVVDELATCGQLLTSQATDQAVREAKDVRERERKKLIDEDAATIVTQLNNVNSWLEASKLDQEEVLDELQSQCHEGSCDWLYDNPKIKSWIRQGHDHHVLWLRGKPGSGKSVLCSKLIQKLQDSTEVTVVYFLCTEALLESTLCRSFLRGLTKQLLQKQPALSSFIQSRFVNNGLRPSVPQLRRALGDLLSAFHSVRVVLDGLDECNEKEQKAMIQEAITLTNGNNSLRICKVLVSSQDTILISRSLRTRSNINLSNERAAVQMAITSYVRSSIAKSTFVSHDNNVSANLLTQIEHTLIERADGMFLWVRLVISMLENSYDDGQMQKALDDIPEGLEKVYERILDRLRAQMQATNSDRASRIFQWLTYCRRPLKKFELQDAVTLHPGNERIDDDTRVKEHVFELCKPLVENGPGDVVRFVHVSVREYLLKHSTLFTSDLAMYNVAFTCIKYLCSFGVNLIAEDCEDDPRIIEVCKGFHGLCQYTSRYWSEHLLSYMTLSEGDGSHRETILALAENLANTLSLHVNDNEVAKLSGVLEKLEKVDDRLKLFKDKSTIYQLLATALNARLEERIAPRLPRGPKRAEYPVVRIRLKYEELTRRILRSETLPGVDDQMLAVFKKTYSSSILVCRFGDCPKAVVGFDTAQARDEHEKSHSQGLRCPHQDCIANQGGLANAKALKQHLDEVHPQVSAADVQPSIRPFNQSRIDTAATLVNSPPPADSFDVKGTGTDACLEDEETDDGDDEEKEEEEYGTFRPNKFLASDRFALGTAHFDW